MPKGTSHYSGFHNYWSRIWTTTEKGEQPPLGEDYATKHGYDFGEPEADLAPRIVIGSADCIRNGELLPSLPVTLVGGWDTRCYANVNPSAPSLTSPIDVRDCHWQKRCVQAIDLIYTQNAAAAVAFLSPFLPGATVTGFDNNPSVIPGCVIVVQGNFSAIIMAGTTNFQQWALQGLTGVSGLVDFGQYSTLMFWFLSSQAMQERLRLAGANPLGSVCYVGHSYGGALACIMAVRTRIFNQAGDIQVMTYGCPKPGDRRFTTILATCVQAHFVNDDDPVTFIPPSRADLGLLGNLVPDDAARRWVEYSRPEGLIGLTINGVRYDSPLPENVYGLVLRIVRQWLTGNNIEVVTAHRTDEYARRINCPMQPTPSPDPGLQPALWLQGESLVPYALGDDIGVWPDSSIYKVDAVAQPGDQLPTGDTGYVPYVNALSGSGSHLSFGQPLTPAGDFSLFVVMEWEGLLGLGQNVVPVYSKSGSGSWLAVRRQRIGLAWATNSLYLVTPITELAIHLYTVRRIGAVYQLWLDRTMIGAFPTTGIPAFSVDGLGLQTVGPPTSKRTRIFELLYLDGAVSGTEFDVWADLLCNSYGIP